MVVLASVTAGLRSRVSVYVGNILHIIQSCHNCMLRIMSRANIKLIANGGVNQA